jgi:hypothetical protein
LNAEQRRRLLTASLAFLGDDPSALKLSSGQQHPDASAAIPPRAQSWAKQHGVTGEAIEQVFHVADGKAEVIAAELPGTNKKEKTYSAYVLTGIAALISTGVASFDDKSARALCESSGCYDLTNHAATIKNKGNEFTGTKEKGWTLTAPGLKRGAEIVKSLTDGK